MGNVVANLFGELFGSSKKDVKILMLGLDGVGKTTILYKLKMGEVLTTIPTLGFNIESVTYQNLNFQVWDIGGQDRIRKLWRYYFEGMDGLIFVVDGSDSSRISEVQKEINRLLSEPQLQKCSLLILANKMDLPVHLSVTDLINKLDLIEIGQMRKWHVQAICALTGEGLLEGLDWLAGSLK